VLTKKEITVVHALMVTLAMVFCVKMLMSVLKTHHVIQMPPAQTQLVPIIAPVMQDSKEMGQNVKLIIKWLLLLN
jgi:hypothetical protein